MQHNSRWHILETAEQVATAAYWQILDAAEHAIAEHGTFKLVLAGGSTPEKVYRLLAQADADWANWHIYYGDERCLPVDHADRNSLMATQAFLGKVAIPDSQIFTIPAELGRNKLRGSISKLLPMLCRLTWFYWVWVKMAILPVCFPGISIRRMNWHTPFTIPQNHRRNAFR